MAQGKKYKRDESVAGLVQTLAGFGIPQEDIARHLKVDPKTLRANYRDELDNGTTVANAKVAESLYKAATATDAKGKLVYKNAVTAQIFWLKTRAGWSEYSPPPSVAMPTEKKLGKKQQAELDAETADEGTPWSELVH
jgi:hypothetical protein